MSYNFSMRARCIIQTKIKTALGGCRFLPHNRGCWNSYRKFNTNSSQLVSSDLLGNACSEERQHLYAGLVQLQEQPRTQQTRLQYETSGFCMSWIKISSFANDFVPSGQVILFPQRQFRIDVALNTVNHHVIGHWGWVFFKLFESGADSISEFSTDAITILLLLL